MGQEYKPRNRREFLHTTASLTAAVTAATTLSKRLPASILQAVLLKDGGSSVDSEQRARISLKIRQDAALRNHTLSRPSIANNGDEERYEDGIANYSKGLPHCPNGIVQADAYTSFLAALRTEHPGDLELIPLGGTVRLVNPQAGLTFDLEGMDSHQTEMKPAPSFAGAERAGEAVECYWMALLRDVQFEEYSKDRTLEACKELSNLRDFRGPKVSGRVTPKTLFRGLTSGDLAGPYISQFLLHSLDYGALLIHQRIKTYLSQSNRGTDYLTDTETWLAAQNGQGPFEIARFDPTPRYIRNGRDLAAYVHGDQAFQAFFNATLFFANSRLPLNSGNPYRSSKTQIGFATFGLPHIQGLLGAVSGCALRAVWYQKWFVHRTLRPEEFGGRLHFLLTGKEKYPIHPDALNSTAVAQVHAGNGTCFLPQAFPEGCPQHPSYGQGHAAVAGACATLLKAFLDERLPMDHFTRVVQPATDGLSLTPYDEPDVEQITIGSELNKLASNIALGRNFAGIHWRSDYAEGLTLGEEVAMAFLRDQRQTFTEDGRGLSFTKFDATPVTI